MILGQKEYFYQRFVWIYDSLYLTMFFSVSDLLFARGLTLAFFFFLSWLGFE